MIEPTNDKLVLIYYPLTTLVQKTNIIVFEWKEIGQCSSNTVCACALVCVLPSKKMCVPRIYKKVCHLKFSFGFIIPHRQNNPFLNDSFVLVSNHVSVWRLLDSSTTPYFSCGMVVVDVDFDWSVKIFSTET